MYTPIDVCVALHTDCSSKYIYVYMYIYIYIYTYVHICIYSYIALFTDCSYIYVYTHTHMYNNTFAKESLATEPLAHWRNGKENKTFLNSFASI